MLENMTNIENIIIVNDGKNIVIKSEYELECLSNAAVNGGRIRTKYIINHEIPLFFNKKNLLKEIKPIKKEYNLSDSTIGLFTAVKMKNAVFLNDNLDNINYTLIITAGLTNANIPLFSNIENQKDKITEFSPGTINIILLVDSKLSEHALVNLFIIITEIKTYFINLSNIKTSQGLIATGTSTDTIVVGFTNKGHSIEWSGSATKFGKTVGTNVLKLLERALKKWEYDLN